MKNSSRALALLAVACIAPALHGQTIPGAVLAKREPHHHLTYEDSTIRVLRVRVPAHDTTLLHEHGPDYFWIALGASEVVNAKLGAPDATIKSQDLSIHYTPGKFAHVARNPGTAPFDNITVELLGAQTNVRNLCEYALAASPRNCVRAAANEHAAFQSDQLHVSLVTIAPGKSLDASARTWVIALDTSDTRSAIGIQGSGRWIGGVYRAPAAAWAIRNRGQHAVRVLAVTTR
jgi:hypothetical protein